MIKFAEFGRQYNQIKVEIDEAIHRVLDSGWYILGQEGQSFEREFAGYIGSKHAVGCASGTEAIALALMALEIGLGDEVITVPNTAVPTVTGISMTGATPVLIDIEPDTLMMDVEKLKDVITERTKAIVPVHLFGSSVKMNRLMEIAQEYNIPVVEDCAQSHGSKYCENITGTFGRLAAFSFYPSKNLGCYGDGGAITTNDKILYEKLLMLRNYGQEKRYYHTINGINSRLDEIQAAILRVKLNKLDNWNNKRRFLASIYNEKLSGLPIKMLFIPQDVESVNHLFVIRTEKRDELQEYLSNQGIQTLIHYPIPIHLQKAYSYLGYTKGAFPISEQVAKEILSLPMWPELTVPEVELIVQAIRKFFEG